MNKVTSITLKVLAIISLTMVVLLVLAFILVNTKTVQDKVMKQATQLLTEKLGTHVSIGSADISILSQNINLYDIEIDDLQKRKMLQVERFSVNLELMKLLKKRIVVEKAEICGLHAQLFSKTETEPANYQFIIDAFKKPQKETKEEKKQQKEKEKLGLDVSKIRLKDIRINYDQYNIRLQVASYSKTWGGLLNIEADSLQASWIAENKKGPINNLAAIRQLKVKQQDVGYLADLNGLHFTTDNHKPRKNTGKPKRGFFDTGHLDITADLRLSVDPTDRDTLKTKLIQCTVCDSVTGINIRNLQASAKYAQGKLHLRDIDIQQQNTQLFIVHAEMQLPNKKDERPLTYSTGTITGKVMLKDISRTFAPVLKDFSLPLELSLTMSGTDNSISFRDVNVSTTDKKLTVSATGDITNLKEKEQLAVRFHVNNMQAKNNIAEKIIHQFNVKKMMMKQLRNLGNLSYTGDFAVLWKKEEFKGLLRTGAGNINFNFALDENNKYVSGQASTQSLNFGKVMNLNDHGNIVANAKFNIDISKPRTAAVRKKKGGKLPIGSVDAMVDDCVFKGVHIRNLSANIKSDGAEATGDVYQRGKRRDIFFSFSLTNTDEMQKMKITHPGIKFHKMSEEDKKARDERKVLKQKAKEEKKALKQKAKEEKKALKQQQKAQRSVQ